MEELGTEDNNGIDLGKNETIFSFLNVCLKNLVSMTASFFP
jgi:hypothetical protein